MTVLRWHDEGGGIEVADTARIDQRALRTGRLARLRRQMAALDIAAVVLSDPINLRYATGARNMQVFSRRNPGRYVVVPLTGPVVLFEFFGCAHLSAGLETIDEVRPATTASYVAAGPHLAAVEQRWADEIAELVRDAGGAGATVGIERVNAGAAAALARHGFRIVDAQHPVEQARARKTAEEIAAIRESIHVTELGVSALRDAIRPGITEQALWSVLHQAVIARGADYIETRLLNAGPRTNPWFQETGDRPIAADELVALDTDVVGVHGYYADFSRTFHAGPGSPTPAQRTLYGLAREQVDHNVARLGPGLSFRDYVAGAWPIPDRFRKHRYYLMAHGCGMTGEWPYIPHPEDWDASGYDGEFEPGMTVCVESFIGAEDGGEGVKLEDQILITETGTERLSRFAYEAALEAA